MGKISPWKTNLKVGYLYADYMNIYGDTGNIIALQKRAQWRDIRFLVKNISLKDKLEGREIDIYFFGGGQDQAQKIVSHDLIKSGKGKVIREDIERGVPLLSICGGYQLLGDFYQPHKGPKLLGIGLLPVYTIASFDRMIGNIVIEVDSSWFIVNSKNKDKQSMNYELISNNYLVGFENHSGKTYLKEGAIPLGKVISGFGNNGENKTEGCVYKNAVGCYMHGSLLPKNPALADWFLEKALEIKYGQKIKLKPLDDSLEIQAHQSAVSRFG